MLNQHESGDFFTWLRGSGRQKVIEQAVHKGLLDVAKDLFIGALLTWRANTRSKKCNALSHPSVAGARRTP